MEIGQVINKKYIIRKHIGSGSFGKVYKGKDTLTGKSVAIKSEELHCRFPKLIPEANILNSLKNGIGIPMLHFHGSNDTCNYLVMELLGRSLDKIFKSCHGVLGLKTILILAYQMIERIKYAHKKGIVHRDIKPQNFAIGLGENRDKIYLIDFGLAKRFMDETTHKHVDYKENRGLVGTLWYISINTHLGIEYSRRDDLESIGYLLSYFMQGYLPWQTNDTLLMSVDCCTILEKKQTTRLEELYYGYPNEFIRFMMHIKGLRFDEKPNYKYLKGLIENIASRESINLSDRIEWDETKRSATPTPGAQRQGCRKKKVMQRASSQQLIEDESSQISNNKNSENDESTKMTPELLHYRGPIFENKETIMLERVKTFGEAATDFDTASDANSGELFEFKENDGAPTKNVRLFERDPAYKITPVLEDYKGPSFKDKQTLMIKRRKNAPKISIDFASSNESSDSNS